MRVALYGATGRMGRELVACASASGAEIVNAFARRAKGEDLGTFHGTSAVGVQIEDAEGALDLADVDVVIDFSLPVACGAIFRAATESGTPLVSGTTGLGPEEERLLSALAEKAPVVWAPNFSQGVVVLKHVLHRAAKALGDAYDAEIVEMHHREKRDAPSGTALFLAEAAAEAKGLSKDDLQNGWPAKREHTAVGLHAVRGGTIVGEHTAILAGPGERIELTHRAGERAIFARGALRAARFVAAKRAPGRYTMEDVLGLAT
ncbi:MAG: 4-hydroxy-tetrahydrodipicolinate reductase [Myxococcota bacterium]